MKALLPETVWPDDTRPLLLQTAADMAVGGCLQTD